MKFGHKDQWLEWAREWDATHRPEKGWLRRTESVLGARGGLLYKVAWGADEDPGLHVCVRFPRAADTQRLRDTLIADAALEVLPGKGAARRKMAVELGPKRAFRWSERPEFVLSENSLLWRRTFSFKIPKAAEIAGWVDALAGAIARATPVFDGRCESCGTGNAGPFVVVDDLPTLLCTTCEQRLRHEGEMAERSYEMSEARHLNGAIFAGVAAVLSAFAWGAIGALTQRIFAVAAMGIGALVAFAYRRGAGRVDPAGRVIGATLTLLSVILGEVVLLGIWVARERPDLGFDLRFGWWAYVATWAKDPGAEVIPLLFGLVGAWFATKALQKPKLAAKVESASPAEPRKAA